MTTTWVLMVALLRYNAVGIESHEFNTPAECQAAAKLARQEFSGMYEVRAICVEKTGKKS